MRNNEPFGVLTRRDHLRFSVSGIGGLLAIACGGKSSPASTGAPPPNQGSVVPTQSVESTNELIVYSGRKESLIGALFESYEKERGLEVKTRYGGTAELAATILEEGKNSPADLFFAQDAGGLGAVASEGRFRELPRTLLDKVDSRFRSPQAVWMGISGRARVVVYNTEKLTEETLPDTVWGFTDSQWKGKLGWPPTNGSFQAFVTALRVTEGEQKAREWLENIKANEPKRYNNNTSTVDATGKGEVLAGFVNHYYLYRFLKEHGETFPARNYHLRGGGPGAIINLAGVGVLASANNANAATDFIDYMLSHESQQYFANKTFEYPLVAGVKTHPLLVPLEEIKSPNLDLSNLTDLKGTLELLTSLAIL